MVGIVEVGVGERKADCYAEDTFSSQSGRLESDGALREFSFTLNQLGGGTAFQSNLHLVSCIVVFVVKLNDEGLVELGAEIGILHVVKVRSTIVGNDLHNMSKLIYLFTYEVCCRGHYFKRVQTWCCCAHALQCSVC